MKSTSAILIRIKLTEHYISGLMPHGKIRTIASVARSLGLKPKEFELYGHCKAKVALSLLEKTGRRRRSKYIIVSGMTPTPHGLGKTVTTIGLSMALNRLRCRAACVLRQASLGPLFGSKGGACGGGAAQLVPAEDLTLHLTGDAYAVAAANNLLVAFAENAIFHGNPLGIDPLTLTQKRCLDTCDRSLRRFNYVLKSLDERHEMTSGFETTSACEVMSILGLSYDFADLRRRLASVVIGRTKSGSFVKASDIKADGMMAVVLKDAARPNLAATSEGTPCFIHAGPFANVSIGSSSVIADRIALGLCDAVVTESGFGADCGGEKFFDLKCRASGLVPDVCVLVCTVRAVKAQSRKFASVPLQEAQELLSQEDASALEEGAANLKKQIANVRCFGVPVIVCINVFETDTKQELRRIGQIARDAGAVDCLESWAWRQGSKGALALAQSVIHAAEKGNTDFRFLYADDVPLKGKIEKIAGTIYGASGVEFSSSAAAEIARCEEHGYGGLPVCISKTQFSLSHDEHLKGAPSGFVFPIKEARLMAGAGFVLASASLTQSMPGLPRVPRGVYADVDTHGGVVGLS